MAWWNDAAGAWDKAVAPLKQAGQGTYDFWKKQTPTNNFVTQALDIPAPNEVVSPTGEAIPDLISRILAEQDTITARMNPDDPNSPFAKFASDVKGRDDETLNYVKSQYGGMRDMLKGSGAQEERDIHTQFNNVNAGNTSALRSRGLGNTTILPGVQAGVERQRSDALGGLQERLRQQSLGLSQSETGAVGGQMNAGAGNQMNIQGTNLSNYNNQLLSALQNKYTMGMVPFQMDQQLTTQGLNWINNRSDPYPDPSLLYNGFNTFAAGQAPGYSPPKDNSILAGLISGLSGGASQIGGTVGGLGIASRLGYI